MLFPIYETWFIEFIFYITDDGEIDPDDGSEKKGKKRKKRDGSGKKKKKKKKHHHDEDVRFYFNDICSNWWAKHFIG